MSIGIKRKYYDFRQGGITLSPVLQLSNFMMLAYLTINEIIPIYVFAPLFVVTILISFTIVGNKFRKHQTPTDANLVYERSTQAGRTVYQMMLSNKVIMDSLNIPYPEGFIDRMNYMKDIGDNKL